MIAKFTLKCRIIYVYNLQLYISLCLVSKLGFIIYYIVRGRAWKEHLF